MKRYGKLKANKNKIRIISRQKKGRKLYRTGVEH